MLLYDLPYFRSCQAPVSCFVCKTCGSLVVTDRREPDPAAAPTIPHIHQLSPRCASRTMECVQDAPDLLEAIGLTFAKTNRIWETLQSITYGSQPSDCSQLQYLFKWYGASLDSVEQSCEMKKWEGSDWEDKLDLINEEELKVSLMCHHRERVSFDSLISRKSIAVCLYVFNVIFFKCFLFFLGVAVEKFKDTELVSDMSGLTDRLSSLSNKWNLSSETDSWEDGVLRLWDDEISGADDKEDAKKLLFQWILGPLSHFIIVVRCEINKLDGVDDLNALACRAKWGNELCKLLRFLDRFLESVDTEFLYEEFTYWYCYTADCFLNLRDRKRARELLAVVKGKLDGLGDQAVWVPKWGTNRLIKYQSYPSCSIDSVDKMTWNIRVLEGLCKATGKGSYVKDMDESRMQLWMEIERNLGNNFDLVKELATTAFQCQINDIMTLVEGERYSEADKKFKQLDPEECRSNGKLRKFLERLLSSSSPPKSWESYCQKQNLLLDVSEDLGDSQFTAILLRQYGIFIGNCSLERLPNQHRWRPRAYGIMIDDSAEAKEVSSLKLWLKEELNLEFPEPTPASVQEVISCLRDDCSVDEHKRELPEMLKACRLIKRSIDIYSNLLQNWTQGLSNETEWLQLCESQKLVHDILKSYLLLLYGFCRDFSMENNDVTTLNQPHTPTIISDSAQKACNAFLTSAMLWVERGRTRSLLSQCGPWYSMIKHGDENSSSLKDELIRFDKDEKAAFSSIVHSCRLARSLGSKPLFLEYTSLGHLYAAFMIEVVGEGELYRFREALRFTVEDLDKVPDEDSEKLHWAGADLADDDLDKLPDEDLEKLADPKTVNKLLYVFYKIVPRQKNSNKECVVAKLHSVLEKLYDILIRPFLEDCSCKPRDPNCPIIFVPDKTLYRVPFALLRDKETKKYLFELHTISIAPSLRVLQHCARRLHALENFSLKRECILAVGNPAYDNVDELLPGTGKELEHLRECFPDRVKRLEKHEATRSKFLELVKETSKETSGEASSSEDRHAFAFMHLGVHGHWSEAESHKTGSLQFAAPPSADISTGQPKTGQSHTSELKQESGEEIFLGDDGKRHRSAFGEVGAITRTGGCISSATDSAMLPAEEIIRSGIEWRTRLVVLSACNSSRGQAYYDGEVNLPRALMIAGVPAAVVSQWKIDDEASPVLMKAFYEKLRYGADVASALQSAMIYTRQYTDTPDCAQNIFQWGSFVVWGLPSVTLPEDLLYDHVKAVRSDFGKLRALLDSADNICALDKSTIDDAFFAVERILACPWVHKSAVVSQVVEAYTLVPLEDISRVEFFFETNDKRQELFDFRLHLMFAQAMNGSHQKALECVNWMITLLNRKCSYDDLILQAYRQERAVIWRLMGEYDKAVEEFTALLALGEDYECLTQMSFLKHLMDDASGALEYACRAKRVKRSELEERQFLSQNPMTLGICALPDSYRHWLANVDELYTTMLTINPGSMVTTGI